MSTQVIIFLATAVVLPLLLTEFGDWCPSLAKRLARWTAQRLGDVQATERYSEEWEAELGHLPGKLSHLLTAISYLTALPRIRWSLRAVRRANPAGPSLDELLPTRLPFHWNQGGVTTGSMGQELAHSRLISGILHEDPRVRNRLHFLIGAPGYGKSTIAQWLHESLTRAGKKVHYVWALSWANERHPIHVSAQMRDRLTQASQGISLLIVDEADTVTVQVLEALRLPCPVLVVGRAPGELGAIERLPINAGVVVRLMSGYDPLREWFRPAG